MSRAARRATRDLRVVVVGTGLAGRALAEGLSRAGLAPLALRGRGRWPSRLDAQVAVLAVPDHAVPSVARRLDARLPDGAVTLHLSGALPDRIDGIGRDSGRLHPLLSLAGSASPRGVAWVRGAPAAVRRARELAASLGWSVVGARLDPVAYHAAAALLANGAVALAARARRWLERAGYPEPLREEALGALLASVANNLLVRGLPGALTGPVRRGDHETVRAHLAWLRRTLDDRDAAPDLALYREVCRAQLSLARELAEAPPQALERIDLELRRAASPAALPRRATARTRGGRRRSPRPPPPPSPRSRRT